MNFFLELKLKFERASLYLDSFQLVYPTMRILKFVMFEL
jgi:hypothetical protein